MTETCKIFVIDDSEDDRSLYRRTLRQCSQAVYEVSETDEGANALKGVEDNAPDCVLLDYSLPGRNGVEVLKQIRAAYPFLPVVMLTGQGNETVAVAAMQAGAQDYITKSAITPEGMHRAISFAIAHCALEQQLHEQRLSLEIFTRALAHDLREPVRTIKSFMSIIAEGEPLTTDGRRYVGYVHDAAERMAALIDAVYYYTRLDRSAEVAIRESCDVASVVEETRLDLGELIREREAVITVGPLPHVHANRQQLRQVLQNLLSNAIRHSESDPIIHISAVEKPDCWEFRVADNGDGVTEAQREKIFEPFARFAHRKVHGLGMGLAICTRIVDSHGGRIWCEPGETDGSVFAFTLPKELGVAPAVSAPARRAGDVAKEAAPSTAEPGPLAKILIVDDNEAAIEMTRIVLVKSGKLRCVLVTARGGREALALMREEAMQNGRVDLVLLDINMPEMDGFEFLQHLREDQALQHIPVVMCTNSSYDKDMERAQSLGATGYVTKPADLNKLRAFLGNMPMLRLMEKPDGSILQRVA